MSGQIDAGAANYGPPYMVPAHGSYFENVPGPPNSYKMVKFEHAIPTSVPLSHPIGTPEGRAEYIVWTDYLNELCKEVVLRAIERYIGSPAAGATESSPSPRQQ